MNTIIPQPNPEYLKSRDIHRIAFWRKKYLLRLQDFIVHLRNEARIEAEKGAKYIYSWDWDMIQNYIEDTQPRSVYAGALNGTLKSSRFHNNKILILDGAKREMSLFLSNKASQFRKMRLMEEAHSRESKENIENQGVFRHDNWQNIKKNTDFLSSLQSIRKLKDFLTRHAISLEDINANFAKISVKKLKAHPEYEKAMQSFSGRYGSRRNEADARNIVRIKLANEEGYLGKLVTGTNIILNDFPDISVDPFLSMVSYLLHQEYSNPEERTNILNNYFVRITELIDNCQIVEKATIDSKSSLSHLQISRLMNALNVLKNDEILAPLLSTLSKAYTFAKNRHERFPKQSEEAKEILEKVPASEFRRAEYLISEILASLLPQEQILSSIGLYWRLTKKQQNFQHWLLYSKTAGNRILSMDITPALYSIYWPVDITIYDFLQSVERILNDKRVPRPSFVLLEYFLEGPLIKTRVIQYVNKKWKLPYDLWIPKNNEIIRIRVITDNIAIFYDPGTSDLQQENIAAVVDSDRNFRWFSEIFAETSSEFVPKDVLKKELTQKLQKMGSSKNERQPRPGGEPGIFNRRKQKG